MNIRIEKMTNPTKEILDLTTNWMFNWWGNEDNYSYSDVFTYMANSFNKKKLPQTYLMFLDDKIIGMYQITYRDLFIRPDIYPWVANIYIDKNYRKQGYGKLLIKSIKEKTKLFLYSKRNNLYEKYGWKYVEILDDNGNKLYELDLK